MQEESTGQCPSKKTLTDLELRALAYMPRAQTKGKFSNYIKLVFPKKRLHVSFVRREI